MSDGNAGEPIPVGLVGYGYWGGNLARNFARQPDCRLVSICDIDDERRQLAHLHYPHTDQTNDIDDLLGDDQIAAVLIATPVASHYQLVKRALEAGKDVLVEKPMATDVGEARELADLADDRKRILAVDHTFLYTGAVRKIRDLIQNGEIGDIIYMDSVRVNLGLFQHDVNVIWDLAPHDLSIFAYVSGLNAVSVKAMGHRYGPAGADGPLESIAYLHIEFEGGAIGHCHLNWVSPVKVRQTLIGGTRKMIVYDDMDAAEKVKVHDKGIVPESADRDTYDRVRVDYRTGDMYSPHVDRREALDLEAEEFLASVRTREPPLSDARFGVRIVRLLAACQESIKRNGEKILLSE